MLIAALSDTHLPRGARRLPEALTAALRGADLILHGGDFSALSVLEELRALGPPVQGVRGNADEPALHSLLPESLVVEAEEVRIGLVHIPGPAACRKDRKHGELSRILHCLVERTEKLGAVLPQL